MTDQPAPETDAMLASDPPSDWPAFARALERERNAARADVARLRTALEGMLIAEMEVRQMDGFSADEAEAEPHWMAARAALATLAPETDAMLAASAATEESSVAHLPHSPPSDWPAFAHAEQDIAFSLGEHAMFCVHHTDAERVANTVGGNCPICNKAQIRQLRAERDTANALSLSLCADRDNDANDRDDEIAVLRAERILSWKENTKQRHELDEVWAKIAECRAALEMIASADGATTPGTAAWASAEIARAALATLSK